MEAQWLSRMDLYAVALWLPFTGTKRPKHMPAWHCPWTQSDIREDMVWQVWCGRARVARMSFWNLTLPMRLSSLFSREWILANRMLGREAWRAWAFSLFSMPGRSNRGRCFGSHSLFLLRISLGQHESSVKNGNKWVDCKPVEIRVFLSYLMKDVGKRKRD